MPGKPNARSITDRLIKFARDQKIPFDYVAVEFLLERLAYRLASSKELDSKLVFKGGYVALRVYHSPRYTFDLDALLKGRMVSTIEKDIIRIGESDAEDGANFKYESSADLTTLGEYGGKRFNFRASIGPLPKNIKKARLVNFDLGFGDPVTPDAVKEETPSLLGGENLSWKVYPIETAAAEKLNTLIARGVVNSRAKDVFDLQLFIPSCDAKLLVDALKATFKYRETELPRDLAQAIESLDTSLLRKGWTSAVAGVPDAPNFDVAFARLVAALREKLR